MSSIVISQSGICIRRVKSLVASSCLPLHDDSEANFAEQLVYHQESFKMKQSDWGKLLNLMRINHTWRKVCYFFVFVGFVLLCSYLYINKCLCSGLNFYIYIYISFPSIKPKCSIALRQGFTELKRRHGDGDVSMWNSRHGDEREAGRRHTPSCHMSEWTSSRRGACVAH